MKRFGEAALWWSAFWHSRALSVIVFCTLICTIVIWVVAQQRFVTIYDEGRVTCSYTTLTDPQALLAEQNIEVGEYDVVTFSGEAKRMEITIDRAYPVYVTADGLTRKVYVTDATVDEALAMCEVDIDANDMVSLPLSRPLSAEERVIVTRIDYSDDYYTEEIPYDTEYQVTSLLHTGVQRTLSTGSSGEKLIMMREKYVDGELIAGFEQSELVTVEPIPTTALLGQAGAAISPYEAFDGIVTDQNGAPVNYTAVYTNMRTTSYYTGYVCASGLPAQVGHIGVNPAVFPYGTKLYIASADGKFVYGYCIAADCGPGTLNNTIDIDLYFNTYYECSLLGRRNDIVVYVLP